MMPERAGETPALRTCAQGDADGLIDPEFHATDRFFDERTDL